MVAALGATFLGSLDALMVTTALPSAAQDIGGVDLIAVTVGATTVAVAMTFPVAGAVIDREGVGRSFAIACSLFAAANVLGGLAPSMPVVAVSRAILGPGRRVHVRRAARPLRRLAPRRAAAARVRDQRRDVGRLGADRAGARRGAHRHGRLAMGVLDQPPADRHRRVVCRARPARGPTERSAPGATPASTSPGRCCSGSSSRCSSRSPSTGFRRWCWRRWRWSRPSGSSSTSGARPSRSSRIPPTRSPRTSPRSGPGSRSSAPRPTCRSSSRSGSATACASSASRFCSARWGGRPGR